VFSVQIVRHEYSDHCQRDYAIYTSVLLLNRNVAEYRIFRSFRVVLCVLYNWRHVRVDIHTGDQQKNVRRDTIDDVLYRRQLDEQQRRLTPCLMLRKYVRRVFYLFYVCAVVSIQCRGMCRIYK